VTIDVASVTTGVQALDGNIASKNFFDPKVYPEIHFIGKEVIRTGAKTAQVVGDLTIHGVTKATVLDVKLVHKGEHALKWFHAAYKGDWLGFKASTTILRSEFGLNRWAPFVSDRIKISISAALYKKRKK
jgi:polyisoprenoid-binding protein YceI